LFGGELGASFIQFFLHSRQVFHFDVLAAGIQGGSAPAVARARLLHAGTRATAATLDVGLGRSAILLGGSVQQQAFTQAVGDAFILIAYVATGCLLIVVCLKTLNVGFKQIIAASAAAKAGS
jgi:MFS transporter, DHA2 family, multidrug resistance protein